MGEQDRQALQHARLGVDGHVHVLVDGVGGADGVRRLRLPQHVHDPGHGVGRARKKRGLKGWQARTCTSTHPSEWTDWAGERWRTGGFRTPSALRASAPIKDWIPPGDRESCHVWQLFCLDSRFQDGNVPNQASPFAKEQRVDLQSSRARSAPRSAETPPDEVGIGDGGAGCRAPLTRPLESNLTGCDAEEHSLANRNGSVERHSSLFPHVFLSPSSKGRPGCGVSTWGVCCAEPHPTPTRPALSQGTPGACAQE